MTNIAEMPKYQSYKDSTEGWIGEVPKHWHIRKLKHLFYEKKHRANMNLNCGAISFGKVVTKDDEKILQSTKASYQEVLSGEFLINPLNLNYDLISLRIALSEIDVVVSAGYIVIKEREALDKGYFKYFLHRYDVAYMKLLGSGVRQTISFNHIANSLLVFPPLEEQNLIANFLDQKTAQIDEAIAIKEQQINLLKERKQIIIQQAVTQGLDPNVPMKDSGVEWIGKIPAHWEVFKLSHIAKIDAGSTPDRSNAKYWNGDIPWIKTGEVKYSKIYETEEYITSAGLKNSSLRLAPVNTLVMAMYGQGVTRGRVAILGVPATYNQACCGMTFKELVSVEYAQYFFIAAYPYIRDDGNESSQMNLSAGYISSLKMCATSFYEQLAIVKYLDEKIAKVEEAMLGQQAQIEKLKEYKTTLINSAVTGKIKITPEMVKQ
jgi:type I restriction enzyme S subunit